MGLLEAKVLRPACRDAGVGGQRRAVRAIVGADHGDCAGCVPDDVTGGGPDGATTSLPYLVYGNNSIIKNNSGLQAAVAVLLFVVLLVLSLLQIKGVEKRVHYAD